MLLLLKRRSKFASYHHKRPVQPLGTCCLAGCQCSHGFILATQDLPQSLSIKDITQLDDGMPLDISFMPLVCMMMQVAPILQRPNFQNQIVTACQILSHTSTSLAWAGRSADSLCGARCLVSASICSALPGQASVQAALLSNVTAPKYPSCTFNCAGSAVLCIAQTSRWQRLAMGHACRL